MIPKSSHPIIIADSGFRTPFYRHVEKLGWHWVGRIRGQDFIYLNHARQQAWCSAQSLHQKATTTAKYLANIKWVRRAPLLAFIVLIRQSKKQRKALTLSGKKRRSKRNNVHAKREKEPWVLVASLSLQGRSPKQIVKIYRARMQIEEGFRDCKAVHYGLGLSQDRRINSKRRSLLCLIAHCATFVLWCIGVAGKQTIFFKRVRVNSSSKQEPYSLIFLARLLLTQAQFRLPEKAIKDALNNIKAYMDYLLCE